MDKVGDPASWALAKSNSASKSLSIAVVSNPFASKYFRFRPLGNLFQIWPAIGAAHVLGFEYVSNAWAQATGGGAFKGSFTVDTDTCIWPDRLMVLFLKRKYWEIKGFDTTAIERDFDAELDLAKAHDAGSPTLAMNPRINSVLIGWNQIPDSGYGS